MVQQIETVSSHFSYTEEYVLEHTPDWLHRKYYQAAKEKWQESQARVFDGFKSIALMVDTVFNEGKNHSDFMPESFEKALAQQQKQQNQETETQFVTGQWWKGAQ